MLYFIIRRLAALIPKMFIVVTIIFFTTRLGPGDPAQVILGDYASEQLLNTVREELGLNQPILTQYFQFLKALIRLDLGNSFINKQPVIEPLKRALPYTLELTAGGLLYGILIGVPIGLLGAAKKDKWQDFIGRTFSIIGISIPGFILCILLMIIFSIKIGWFPATGGGEFSEPLDHLHHLVLPVLGLGTAVVAFIVRMVRSSTLEVLSQDYIRTARAKGVPERYVLFDHVLKNSLIPIVTIVGMYVIITMVGAVMTEIVFNRPGLGTLIVAAIKRNDFPLIQAALMVYAGFVVIVNLMVDISYAFLDPRIRLA
jgi:ABC-type dipeptide/oligopeptide/nickel transport system permease component